MTDMLKGLSALDEAHGRINAIGGYAAADDEFGKGVNSAVEQALDILEKLGARDPAIRRLEVDHD